MEGRDVFLVQHVHVLEDREEDVKTIGIYSTREAAERAVERLKLQPGFRDTPEGFTIDMYRLDQDHWEEGYVTLGDSSGSGTEGLSGPPAEP
jgi:hypothetical protein